MKKILLLAFLVLGSHLATAQNKYDKLWNKVEKLELEGKIKRANEIVEKILRKAKRSNKSGQIVKGFIYKSKFSSQLKENAQKGIISDLEASIQKFEFPTNALLESVYAGFLEKYLRNNRYRISNRTPLKFSENAIDLEKWDVNTFIFQIDKHYRASLKEEQLLKMRSIKDFEMLLTHSRTSHKFRPTLYDFLAQRAIDFYGKDKWFANRPNERFYINSSIAFASTSTFVKEPFYTKDSILSNRNVLKLYQKLEAFHQQKNTVAYIDVVLDRLKFSKKQATIQHKDTLYLRALRKLSEEFQEDESSSFINYHLANFYYQASNRSGAKKDPILKDYRIKALAICNKVLAQFPNSDGGLLCKILKNKVQKQFITIKTEKYIVPEKPFLAKVSFRNVDSLYLSIFKVPHRTFENTFSHERDSAVVDLIKHKKAYVVKLYKLQPKKDFYLYTTEVDLPKLSKGKYVLVASTKKRITKLDEIYNYNMITASYLSYATIDKNKKQMIKVLDRFDGKSVKGAKVVVAGKDFNQQGITDKNGEFYLRKDNEYHSNLNVTTTYKGDTLSNNRFYIYRYYKKTNNKNSERTAKMLLYLDRSIYRPGQTLYFKGILIEKQNGKRKVVPNTYTSIIISDANSQELKELRLKTNEFGSVSGEFKIPKNVLTGEFSIEMDEDYGTDDGDEDAFYEKIEDVEMAEVYFSVEEYKRPKFEVTFNEVIGNYVLGDSIRVTGNAKALLGTSVSNAKVSYSVTRTLIPYSWGRTYRSGSKQFIRTGTGQTDSKGNFNIDFIAIPDSLAVKEESPVFNYTIKADVTDINGETRSLSKVVRVGFHNIKLEATIGRKLNQNIPQQFTIQAKNLNDQPINANVEIFIYKQSSPNRVLRKKPWDIVELPLLKKNKFIELFPNEVYDSTEIKKYWKKGALIFSKKFSSEGIENITLDSIAQWKPGAYVLLVKGTDIFKGEVSLEKTFEVFHPKEKTLPDHQLFNYEIVNSNYKKDGEVILRLKTAAKSLNVNVEAFYRGASIFSKMVSIDDGAQLVRIPIKRSYKEKIDINLYFSKFNSFDSDRFSVPFPEIEKQLNIETISFRNKLTPDNKETWSFKITDSDQKAVKAEMLASMYDTSLDQFKEHSWDTNIGHNYYSSYAPRVQNNGLFGTVNFKALKRSNRYYNTTQFVRNYHELKWFGFDFTMINYTNKAYLSELKRKIKFKKQPLGNISGVVADDSGGLPGVSVLVKGTNTGAETDFDGFYSLNAPAGSVLVFTYLGYITTELKVGKKGTYNVLMKEGGEVLDEVVVVGYGTSVEKAFTGNVSYYSATSVSNNIAKKLEGEITGVTFSNVSEDRDGNPILVIRGTSSFPNTQSPLFIVDGVPVDLKLGVNFNRGDIDNISVLKGTDAISLYGSRGKNGVVLITTKAGLEKLRQVETRTNLKETAFFFPHITANKKGEVSFSFDSPQALTKWRLMLFAHNKSVEIGSLEKSAVTQKEINIIPNAPRFLREKDTVVISVKIANLTQEQKSGTALIQLFDAVTMSPITQKTIPLKQVKPFRVAPKGNVSLDWTINIPEGLQALQYKIVAKSGAHSDGEASILPVLSNRILITESKPLWVSAGKTQKVTFNKLQKPASKTQKIHRFTLEYTSNPAWLAIKSLPYLMEFPHECAEQTFSRLYANTLANHILTKNPNIKEVFKRWKETGKIESPLETNDDLKSILMAESPWVRDLQKNSDAKAQLASLFDAENIYQQQLLGLSKLKELQMSSGAFPWFAGGRENPFITRHIVAGIGHLKKLNINISSKSDVESILKKAIDYLDKEFVFRYKDEAPQRKLPSDVSLDHHIIHYLYARSFFLDSHPLSESTKKVATAYLEKGKKSWLNMSLYNKSLFALTLYRNGDIQTSKKIMEALDEQAVQHPQNGMYWKENTKSWYWYRSPIETQALMIEAFTEIEKDNKKVDRLKQWLLKNKQTNRWATTKATTEAIYALLMQGSDWLSVADNTVIRIGEEKIKSKKLAPVQKEAGTGYLKLNWDNNEMSPKMATISVKNKSNVTGYGGVYWQYFEDLDKVTSSDTSPLQIKKAVFIKKTDATGERLIPITNHTPIKVGDLITVRIEITSKNDMEFVHLKDLRASGLEPTDVLSSYKWQDGLGYYQSTKDVATHFFFDELPKGTYVFEYTLRANNSGNFSNGITTIQSMYAPEFSSHSKGIRIRID